jgi:putative ABC transport system ATP-binding protein
MSILTAEKISKSFGRGGARTEVLKDASLSVSKGEFVTILGPSGSGKSTLLNICGLLDAPDQGDIIHMGRRVSELDLRQRTEYRREHLGFIFQSFNLVPVMTVADNVGYPLMLLDWTKAEKKSRVAEILEQVGLLELANEKPEQLSGGQCQRVAVARALVKKPSIIIADEPTASLDAVTALKVVELMKQLAKEQGSSFLVATHDDRLLPYSDSVLHVESGGVITDNRSGVRHATTKLTGEFA